MRRGWPLLVGAILAVTAGCSRAPVLVPVTGTVRIDGRPTGAVQVIFYPADGSADRFTTRHGLGITDADGNFRIVCSCGDGIEAGQYKVAFSRPVVRGRPALTSLTNKPEGPGTVESIPEAYRKPETTPVSVTVPSGGGAFPLEVKTT